MTAPIRPHPKPKMLDYARLWARQILRSADHHVILDTETTGLNGDVLQVGIIDLSGRVLLDAIVRPRAGANVDPGALAVHGISREQAQRGAPWPLLREAIAEILNTHRALIYNASFDLARIEQTDAAHLYPQGSKPIYWRTLGGGPDCVMRAYALWFGQLSQTPNKTLSTYKWQRLPGGDHSAVGDARATLALIHRMAGHE